MFAKLREIARRTGASPWCPVGAAVIVAVFLIVAAAVIVGASGELAASQLWTEVLKGLVTLAVGVLVTGGVAAAVAANSRSVEQRKADHALRLELMQQLRNVQNTVKTAALLINANRSVRTYGLQMQEVLSARVSVLDVDWTLRSRPRLAGDQQQTDQLSAQLTEVAAYLQQQVDEYRKEYRRISAIQMYTSKWDEQRAKELAQHSDPPAPEDMETSLVAWQELEKSEAFPHLAALRYETDDHKSKFSNPVNEVIEALITLDERGRQRTDRSTRY